MTIFGRNTFDSTEIDSHPAMERWNCTNNRHNDRGTSSESPHPNPRIHTGGYSCPNHTGGQ